MSTAPAYPSLYEINTRVWLRSLSQALGRPVDLDGIPDDELDRIAGLGFDWVWLLSVWRLGEAGRAVSRRNPAWREEYRRVLPDLQEEDICGSGFAIVEYAVAPALGGDAALARLRQRLKARGLKLMLDFVPNHTAPDHPWIEQHPEYFIQGSEEDLGRAPQNYQRIETAAGPRIFAHGRDPYFPGWPDTLQLNYGNPALQEARIAELVKIAGQCDGVRCDMAMLIVPEVFERTWGVAMPPFWPRAIEAVKAVAPGFLFMAEVYWDMEWELQQQGFDYCYDKRLYDRLRARYARPVREHLVADMSFQRRLVRFLENHDEERAAEAFPLPVHRAAAIATFLAPGLRFFHQGQLEGRRVRIPVHLCRGPDEPADAVIEAFYAALLPVLRSPVLRDGEWHAIDPMPAWAGNWSCESFIAYAWRGADGSHLLVVINYEAAQSQCHLRLPFPELAGRRWRLTDLMGTEIYDRDGGAMIDPGLYVDLGPWRYNVFALSEIA